MSAAEGVPLTRELVEALRDAAACQRVVSRAQYQRHTATQISTAIAWGELVEKLDAALASDAGTGEGPDEEPETPQEIEWRKSQGRLFDRITLAAGRGEPLTLEPHEVAHLDLYYVMGAVEKAKAMRDRRPPDESGRREVREGPHLSDLWQAFEAGAGEQRANPNATPRDASRAADAYVKGWTMGQPDADDVRFTNLPAPAPGDASGETLEDWCATVLPFLDQGIYDGVDFDHDEAHRLAVGHLDRLRRLYRAATGEVIGTATLYGGGKDGTSIGPGPDDELPELDDRESYRVDLVLRRDKEGV